MTHLAHDPGGKVRTRLPEGQWGHAEFSKCGRYRPLLIRYFDGAGPSDKERHVLWIGMNPSTATAEANDPTITREIGFTRREGFRCMVKCNVFDYRATSPAALAGAPARSEENIPAILKAAERASLIIVAWGAIPKPLLWGVRDARQALKGYPLWCLGLTKDGQPRHPLYVAHDAELRRWQ